MSAHDFFKQKIFSKKFSRNQIYLFGSFLFILVIGILVSIVTIGTIQKGKTQAKAAAGSTPKYDPIALGRQFMAGMPTSSLIEVSYDPKAQTADVISLGTTYYDISLPYTVSPANEGESHSFKFKLKDKNQKVLQEAWVNFNKTKYVPDKSTGKITLYLAAPDGSDLQLEFADRGGKKLIDEPFSEMPAKNQGSGKEK